MNAEKDCIYYCNRYVNKMAVQLEGCSDKFKMHETVFSFFNHLAIYFPDAYAHMLKILEVRDENH